jgi:hypothetical protein
VRRHIFPHGGGLWKRSVLKQIGFSDHTAWDYPLKEADFRGLLSNGDPSLKDAALAYAEKINDLHYLSAVSACVADADPAVWRDAKHVEDQLKQRGEWG